MDEFKIKPYFNGANMDLFKKYFFFSKNELLKIKFTCNEIFAGKSLNKNDFGKLIVFPNGDVYANMNQPPLGNISDNMIFEIIYKELKDSKSWLKPRNSVSPCKSCLFSYLCPPISNYEYVLNKHNFCTIV